MKRILVCIYIFASLAVQAQEEKPKGFFKKAVHYITDIDTTFVSPNKYNLAFMLENSNWYETYSFRTTSENGTQRLRMAPEVSYKLGAYFGWRWIFIGYSIDMRNVFKKKKDESQRTEFLLSLYSSVAGCDLFYRKSGNNFTLRNAETFCPEGFTGPLDRNIHGLSVDIAGINAYWIQNHRRFSYPAAYSQSTNQRRNAGSAIVGFTFSKHKIEFDYRGLPDYVQAQLYDGLKFNEVNYLDFCLSAGYAYNWVFAKNCLFNASLAPGIAYKQSKSESEYFEKSILRKINFDLVTRVGITYNNSKYFVGASLVMNTFGYRSELFNSNNSFGTIRIYAGFNFWKKKPKKENDQ